MRDFKAIFGDKKPIIGMIHVQALPGTPGHKFSVREIIKRATEEAHIYLDNGIDGIIVENMHDVPYVNGEVGHEVSAVMSIIAYEVKNVTRLPVGIQILAAANKTALAAGHAAGIDFIRAEGFVFAQISDEGFLNSDAGNLLRYRKHVEAEDILILTDIKKKHASHTITGDIDIKRTAKAAEFFLSDGLIVTGQTTGIEADLKDVRQVRQATKMPLLIGSGITPENINSYVPYADGFIIGSYFKKGGIWQNGPDPERIKKLLDVYEPDFLNRLD